VLKYTHLQYILEPKKALKRWWEKDMNEKVRMNLQVSAELNELLERIAADTGSNRSEVIRQALALMKVAHEAKKKGKHIGLVTDADRLETEIVGLL
jgi:metal-responsive CopG/Arc/MetJ family transcriptional regulator